MGTKTGDPDEKIPLLGYEFSETCISLRMFLVADCFK